MPAIFEWNINREQSDKVEGTYIMMTDTRRIYAARLGYDYMGWGIVSID